MRGILVIIGATIAFIRTLGQMPAVLPRPPITVYFYATAVCGTNESIPSNEVSTTNRQFTLEWSYPEEDLPLIDGFRIYVGRKPAPTNFVYVGRTLAVDWPYIPLRTNVVTLSTPAFALSFTNPPGAGLLRAVIQRSDSPLGPWTNIADIPRAIQLRSYQ